MLVGFVATALAGEPGIYPFESGFQVLVYPDERFETVHIGLTVRVGMADSPPERPDLAHLVEHLMFRVPDDGDTLGAELLAAGCVWNAETRLDTTTYFADCPANRLEIVASRLLRLLDADTAALTDAEVRVEAQIVAQEYLLRGDAAMAGWLGALEGLYGPTDPYGRDFTAVSAAQPVDRRAMQALIDDGYRPDNAVLVVAGNVDASALLGALRAHPKVVAAGLTAADVREYPAGTLTPFGVVTADRWFAGKAGKPVSFVVTAEPPTREVAPPLRPVAATVDRQAPTPQPAVAVAWALPGVTYRTYTRLHDLGWLAASEMARVAPADVYISCDTVAGIDGSVLVCLAESPDGAPVDDLGERMTRVFARPLPLEWEPPRDSYRRPPVPGIGGAWTLDARLAREAGIHALMTGYAPYVEDSYGISDDVDRPWYEGIRARYLGSAQATTVHIAPAPGLRLPEGANETRSSEAVAVDDPPDGPFSKPLAAARSIPTTNGLEAWVVTVPGTFGYYGLSASRPPTIDEITSWRLDTRMHAPAKYRDRDMWTGARFNVLTHAGAWAVWTSTPSHMDRSELVLRSYEALWAEPALWGGAAGRERRIAAVTARRWREADYWRDQVVLERSDASDRVLGFDWDDFERPSDDPTSDLSPAAARLRDATPRFLAVGPYPAGGALDKDVARFLGRPPVDPAPAAAPDTPASVRPGVVVLDSGWDSDVAEVALTCPVRLPDADPADRYVRRALVQQRLQDAAWQTVRESDGSAYIVSASIADWSEFDGPMARLWTSTDVGAAPRVLEQLRAAVSPSAHTDEAALRAARAAVWSDHRRATASITGTWRLAAWWLDLGVPLSLAQDLGTRLRFQDAWAVAWTLEPCDGQSVLTIIGDLDRLAPALSEAGLTYEVFDWRAARQVLLTNAPGRVAREEARWDTERPAP